MAQELKPGDQVQLLSGGPTMTVRKVDEAHGAKGTYVVTCQWFAGKKLEDGKFVSESLKAVDGAEKKKLSHATVPELATLLVARFEQEEFLSQAEAADIVADAGRDDLLRTNDNGNVTIDGSILAEFRGLTEHSAVWMKSARAWRRRDPLTDAPGQREQPL